MINYCNTCRLGDMTQNKCQLTGFDITAEDYCSKWTNSLEQCSICRRYILPSGVVYSNGNIYCADCASKLLSCAFCVRCHVCEFETNPDPMPKVIIQTMQQGTMRMQQQVKNPERIKKFCTDCKCYSEDSGCLKEFHIGCINHES